MGRLYSKLLFFTKSIRQELNESLKVQCANSPKGVDKQTDKLPNTLPCCACMHRVIIVTQYHARLNKKKYECMHTSRNNDLVTLLCIRGTHSRIDQPCSLMSSLGYTSAAIKQKGIGVTPVISKPHIHAYQLTKKYTWCRVVPHTSTDISTIIYQQEHINY